MRACVYVRRAVFLLFAAVLVAFAATDDGKLVPDSVGRLTPEGNAYQMNVSGTRIAVQNTGSGRNNREVYWDKDTPESASATVCATWTSGTDIAQNGIAFRIKQRADGGYNAIVLERNIWANVYWVFNAAMFYTGKEYETKAHADGGPIAKPYDGPQGVDLSRYLGMSSEAAYPLRICASLDADDVLSFAVAKGSDPMPSLADPGGQGGRWKLDLARYYHVGQGREGRHGIYAGHIPPDTSLIFDDVTLSGLSD